MAGGQPTDARPLCRHLDSAELRERRHASLCACCFVRCGVVSADYSSDCPGSGRNQGGGSDKYALQSSVRAATTMQLIICTICS